MAVLRLYCAHHNRIEEDVEVQNATSMGYAAMHVAEAAGFDPEGGPWHLATKGGQPIDPSDLAVDWDGQEVILHRH